MLDLVTNDAFGISDSDDSVDEGEGVYAYLGKTETNTLEKNFLADLFDHRIEPPSVSRSFDIEGSVCESNYGRCVGECHLAKVNLFKLTRSS